MKMLSSFTLKYFQTCMNVFVLNTKEDILKNVWIWAVLGWHWPPLYFYFPTMEVNVAPKQPGYKLSSEYLPLCSEQTHSYRFGNTWGWVNDDSIFIFEWTIPLSKIVELSKWNSTNWKRVFASEIKWDFKVVFYLFYGSEVALMQWAVFC